jgi:hypothetical protein
MSIMINGHEFGQVVEGVAWGASILATAIVVLIVYLMVRPPRHLRNRPPPAARTELEPIEAEELWALVDRMEARLEVLERALSDQLDRPRLRREEREDALTPAEDGRTNGRTE